MSIRNLLNLDYRDGHYVCKTCGGAIGASWGEWVHCDGHTHRHVAVPAERKTLEKSKEVLDKPEPIK